ncbi:TF2AY factor, partial [Bucco capensis]|nr:TF2AY factor [Bucco capensis]
KLYKCIIEDVIEGVQELFEEEGLEEKVLKDLQQRWETKVMQSKATEDFFRHSHRSPKVTLQLPPNLPHILQASAASLVIPTGFQHFPGADQGATLTLPSSLTYPIHVPAGVTLQTTSGRFFKVNVPVMVTQGSGDATILQPVQQLFQPLGQPSVLQANPARTAQAAAQTLQAQEATAQQTMVFQANMMEKTHLENSAKPPLVQQPSVSQQQLAADGVLNQHAESTEKSQHTAVFTPESSAAEALADSLSSELLDVEGLSDSESQEAVQQQQVSEVLIDQIIMEKGLDDNAVQEYQDSIASSEKLAPPEQMESPSQAQKGSCSDTEGIIQLDGTGGVSPKEERSHRDRKENLFVGGRNESEDLKVPEGDEECDSASSTESSSSGGNHEELQRDVAEEDPLNSDDDVSEQDTPDLFDTDNVILCQYDRIHRSKNKWKFFLINGVMSFEGKEHLFAKAIGDAEW